MHFVATDVFLFPLLGCVTVSSSSSASSLCCQCSTAAAWCSVSKLTPQTACYSAPPWKDIHIEVSGDSPSETHTHAHSRTHTLEVALWWDIILSFSMLCYKMYLPLPKHRQQLELCPCLVFPSRLQAAQRSLTPREMEGALLPHYKWLPKSISLFFISYMYTCLVSVFYVHTSRAYATCQLRPLYRHIDRNDDLAPELLFFTSPLNSLNGPGQWNSQKYCVLW